MYLGLWGRSMGAVTSLMYCGEVAPSPINTNNHHSTHSNTYASFDDEETSVKQLISALSNLSYNNNINRGVEMENGAQVVGMVCDRYQYCIPLNIYNIFLNAFLPVLSAASLCLHKNLWKPKRYFLCSEGIVLMGSGLIHTI